MKDLDRSIGLVFSVASAFGRGVRNEFARQQEAQRARQQAEVEKRAYHRAQLQNWYRGVPGPAGLQYYFELPKVDFPEFVRLYIFICAQRDARINIHDERSVATLRNSVHADPVPAFRDLHELFDWASRNSPDSIASLRNLAGI